MTAKMDYCVVTFDNDTSSEIPSNWLTKDGKYCWWPVTKNINSLMEKRSDPNVETWEKHKVVVDSYCNSLQSARKIASDPSYTSSEERGRGHRRKRPIQDYDGDISSDREESVSPPPSFNKSPKIVYQTTYDNLNRRASSSKIGQVIDTYSGSTVSQLQPSCSYTLTDLDVVLVDDLPNNINLSTFGCDQTNKHQTVPNIAVTASKARSSPLSICSSTPLSNESYSHTSTPLAEHNDATLEICSTILKYVESIDRRLKMLENKPPDNEAKFEVLYTKLPIRDLDMMRSFEEFIYSNENKIVYIQALKKLGGDNATEFLKRALKNTFTNEFGIKCSWFGLRNNIRVCDLNFISIIKDVAYTTYGSTDSAVEKAASEWFRLCNLRFKRGSLIKDKSLIRSVLQKSVETTDNEKL